MNSTDLGHFSSLLTWTANIYITVGILRIRSQASAILSAVLWRGIGTAAPATFLTSTTCLGTVSEF